MAGRQGGERAIALVTVRSATPSKSRRAGTVRAQPRGGGGGPRPSHRRGPQPVAFPNRFQARVFNRRSAGTLAFNRAAGQPTPESLSGASSPRADHGGLRGARGGAGGALHGLPSRRGARGALRVPAAPNRPYANGGPRGYREAIEWRGARRRSMRPARIPRSDRMERSTPQKHAARTDTAELSRAAPARLRPLP